MAKGEWNSGSYYIRRMTNFRVKRTNFQPTSKTHVKRLFFLFQWKMKTHQFRIFLSWQTQLGSNAFKTRVMFTNYKLQFNHESSEITYYHMTTESVNALIYWRKMDQQSEIDTEVHLNSTFWVLTRSANNI